MSWYKKRVLEIEADRKNRRIKQIQTGLAEANAKLAKEKELFARANSEVSKSWITIDGLKAKLSDREAHLEKAHHFIRCIAESGKYLLPKYKDSVCLPYKKEAEEFLKQFAAEQARRAGME